MRIAIDTNALYITQAGVARYIHGLRRGLAEMGWNKSDYYECAWPVSNFDYQQPRRALKTAYRELFWSVFLAPKILLREKIELFHTTGPLFVTPPPKIKHVVTLHDLAILRHPERFRPWFRRSATKWIREIPKADRILCISQFTADEAIKLLGISSSQIDVVYNGCDFQAAETLPAERKPDFPIPPEYFLFVGSLEPGKNLSLLREVYALAEIQGKRLPPLMIVGARWEGVTNEGVPPKDWFYLGRMEDEILVYLYRRAWALIFPSKYEGFGLPILEAMNLGCPVICSPVASLPEVGGKAAYFADLTAKSYLLAMLRITQQSELRQELVAKGQSQAQKFSWKKCAQETLEVYRRAFR